MQNRLITLLAAYCLWIGCGADQRPPTMPPETKYARTYLGSAYYTLIDEAYATGRAGDPARAICLLERAFAEARPQPRHLYYGAYLSNLLQDTTAVADYLLRSVSAGEGYERLAEGEHTRALVASSGAAAALRAADADWQQHHADRGAQRLIRELYAVDQHVRRHIFRLHKTEAWAKQALRLTDSLNFEKLSTHLRARGFPDYFRIGTETQRQLHILLLHQTTDLSSAAFAAIDSLLRAQLASGNLFPEQYAHLVDRRLQWGLDRPGRYGTLGLNPDGSIAPVEQPETLDSLRATLGLAPLFYRGTGTPDRYPVGYVPRVVRSIVRCN